MLRRVALLRTDVSEELSASIRVTRIGGLGTTLPVTSRENLKSYFTKDCLGKYRSVRAGIEREL
jgi:hypothetical protein